MRRTPLAAPAWNPALEGFECPECARRVAPHGVLEQPVCAACQSPLVARYDMRRVAAGTTPAALAAHGHDLWRYGAALPFEHPVPELRLGEGGTPLVPLPRLARALGLAELWLKDESPNATQSFKARGLALAAHGALALGRTRLALPSAGNAGSAAAAYAAAAGMRCRVTVPSDTPEAFVIEQRGFGAEVKLVPGTLSDAGRELGGWAPAGEWWNVATFREPFRLEGKKTLGYEIAEQCGWRLPEIILYPTGGGTGLVGMWRAFQEMLALGWIAPPLPRLVSVQARGCAPIVRAFERGAAVSEPWEGAVTIAAGLRVPAPFADQLILEAIRGSNGTAIAVSEEELLDGMSALARIEGCFACPEGGATLAALMKLRTSGEIGAKERVVIFNTGSGLKYLEAWRQAMTRSAGAPA
ncbi:MAG TPA: threonine synthase [Candidatus Udaeobacter sp.]|nr:threonine synthase [Candidatus Udaeobacter sp.]